MREMIDNRLSEVGRHDDIFSNLLRAREEEKDGQTVFTDSDLTGEFGPTDQIINNIDTVSLGNIFIILFAGHETSANTLAIALAALAVHPDAQERFRAEVYEHSTNERMPVRMDLMCIHSSH